MSTSSRPPVKSGGFVASVGKIPPSIWILMALWAVYDFQELLWFCWDQHPPRWDEAGHLLTALHFADALRESLAAFLRAFICDQHYYPPLIPAFGAFLSFLSLSPNFITGSSVFFISLLSLSVFATARRRFGPEAAVAACAIVMCYPLLVYESHNFMLDVPLTALVALSVWALDQTEGFKRRVPSAVLGIICGLGLLIKWTFLVFMIVPLALSFMGKGDGDRLLRRQNRRYALLFAALVAGPWYLWNLPDLASGFWTFGVKQGSIEGLPGFLSLQAFLYYPRILWGTLSLFGFLIVVIGVWSVFREKKHRHLFWAIALPTLIFALLPNKKDRYIMPVLPFTAILSVAWMPRLGGRSRRAASAVLTLGALAMLGNFVWVKAAPDHPQSADWKVQALLSRIPEGKNAILSVVPDHAYLNVATCAYYAHAFHPWIQPIGIFNFPLFADYALVRTGDQGPSFMGPEKRQQLTSDLLDARSPLGKLFEQVSSEPLPDGSTAVLLRRRGDLALSDQAMRSAAIRLLDKFVRNTKGLQFSVVSETDKSKTLTVSFQEGYLGDYAHKPDALRMRSVRLSIRGVVVNPASLSKGEVQLLSVGSLNLDSAEVDQKDLEDFARPFAKGISDLHVGFDGGKVILEGNHGKLPIQIAVTLFNKTPSDANVYFRVEKVKIGFLRIPSFLVNFLLKDKNPLIHKIDTPMGITFGEIRIENGLLQIH